MGNWFDAVTTLLFKYPPRVFARGELVVAPVVPIALVGVAAALVLLVVPWVNPFAPGPSPGLMPWLVTGVLTTAEALGPVPGGHVALTLAVYVLLYLALLVTYLGVLTYLAIKAAKEGDHSPDPAVEDKAMAQPIVAGE